MPEVRTVLDSHLDPARDSALSIRAIYGQWFPWLLGLDSQWTRVNTQRIFPRGQASRNLRDAAWNTYVIFCPPYDDVFEAVREEYLVAVDLIGTGGTHQGHIFDPDKRLTEHLMILYWRGKIPLDEPDSILARFYGKADESLRAHSLSFVGITLGDEEGEISQEIMERLRTLWIHRLEAARSTSSRESFLMELAQFAWWFLSRRLDDMWAVDQLRDVLKLTGRVEAEDQVVERLAEICEEIPSKAVQCLGLIAEKSIDPWAPMMWRDHAYKLLATAIKSGQSEAAEAAVDLIHQFGARGYEEFGALLPKVSDT